MNPKQIVRTPQAAIRNLQRADHPETRNPRHWLIMAYRGLRDLAVHWRAQNMPIPSHYYGALSQIECSLAEPGDAPLWRVRVGAELAITDLHACVRAVEKGAAA